MAAPAPLATPSSGYRGAWPEAAVVGGAGVAAFVWLAIVLMRRADALQTRAFDQAFFQQVTWNLGHGRGFVTNFAPGNALAVHFSPFLALVAIPELLWTDPRLLSLLNVAGLAAAGPAAYLFLRAILPETRAAALLAAAIAISVPFWPAIQEAARSDFHPEALALPMALLAAAAGLRGRRRTFWILALATLTVKEDQVYTVAVIGLVTAARSQSLGQDGRRLVLLAVAWGAITFLVVMPALALWSAPPGQAQLLTASYYGWMLHSSLTAIWTALARPEAWERLGVLLLCAGGLPILRPRWALLIMPPFLADLMSSHYPQMLLHFHYGLLLLVPVLVATGMGASRALDLWPRVRPALVAMLTLPGLAAGAWLGSMPPALAASNPPPGSAGALATLERCATRIPIGAPVAADDNLAGPLASRPRLVEITSAVATDYVAIDTAEVPPGWIDPAQRRLVIAALSSNRPLLCEVGKVEVWGPE